MAAPPCAPVSLVRKIGYGSGQLVELVVSSMLNTFVLFYVTSVCGLPGGLAGLALGAGLVVDAVMDPLIGSLSDGWNSRFGRRVPFMIVGLVPIILSFNLMFALPSNWSHAELFAWLMVLSITLRISLSIFHLPYSALGVELSDDYAERSSIAAWRWGIGILGTLAVIALGYGVFLGGPDGVSRRDQYLALTLTLTAIVIVGGIAAIRTGLVTRDVQRKTAVPTQAVHRRLLGEMSEMVGNRTFRILFGGSLLLNIAQGVNQALALHLGNFYWHLESGQLQVVSLAAVLGLAVAAPLAGPICAHFEKRTMLISATLGLALCQGVPVALKLADMLPFTGAAFSAFLVTMAFLIGVFFALTVISFISIIPDATDEHEYLFGARREGLYFAGWAFASKAATGGGLLIAGVVLQLISFPSNVTANDPAAASIPLRTLEWLAFAGGPGAGLIAIASAGLAMFHHLDRKGHARIQAELASRRSHAGVRAH
jgi:GPH family glycoside/pentoside/hexuronide:cation symporter